VLEQLTLGFQQAGVQLSAGTDTPTSAVVPGFSIHDELQDLVKAGLTPFEALQTATVNPATFFDSLRDSGTIEPRKRADCILLKGNPLDNIANTRLIAGVVRNGRWIGETQIATALQRPANPKVGPAPKILR
jgi:imidazolonepropionase-like amidohydrolase